MCLDIVKMKFTKALLKELNGKVEGIGWKVFKSSIYGDLLPDIIEGNPRPIGKWLHERNFRSSFSTYSGQLPTGVPGITYLIGWHIFGSRSTAFNYRTKRAHIHVYRDFLDGGYVVKKVKYRDARAIGTQHRRRIIVAKEIFIL